MNAFKDFKTNEPITWNPNIYITLVKDIPGTRRAHRHILGALNPTVRGMLQQVKRLVVETEEMYKARKEKETSHCALHPPLVINHLLAPHASGSFQGVLCP